MIVASLQMQHFYCAFEVGSFNMINNNLSSYKTS